MTEIATALFMAAMGLSIAGIWTANILRGTQVDIRGGILRARDNEGSLMLPHWVAEYGTAVGLLAGALGLLSSAPWADPVAAAALGATVYTSTNSLGWAFADSARRLYAVPMVVGALGGLAALIALVVSG